LESIHDLLLAAEFAQAGYPISHNDTIDLALSFNECDHHSPNAKRDAARERYLANQEAKIKAAEEERAEIVTNKIYEEWTNDELEGIIGEIKEGKDLFKELRPYLEAALVRKKQDEAWKVLEDQANTWKPPTAYPEQVEGNALGLNLFGATLAPPPSPITNDEEVVFKTGHQTLEEWLALEREETSLGQSIRSELSFEIFDKPLECLF
jgi:hypothetical protein